jgi:hypothetical protein
MKCVKKHGEIKRVNDNLAKQLVEEHNWSYCPKSEWKEKIRNKKN